MKRIWKWYKRNYTEVFVGLAIVEIACLIYFIHSILSIFPNIELNYGILTPFADIVSTYFLYLAFRQSALANILTQEKVTYQYYIDILNNIHTTGNELWEMPGNSDIITSTGPVSNMSTLFQGHRVIKDVLTKGIFDNPDYLVLRNNCEPFIRSYIALYSRMNFDLIEIRNAKLSKDSEICLLKRYSEYYVGLNSYGNKIEEVDVKEMFNTKGETLNIIRLHYISQLQTIHKPLQELLYNPINESL